MKYLTFITMSLFSFLFGCNTPPPPKKVVEWPRFPATDNPATTVTSIPLADGFSVRSFYITPDKLHLYVLGSRPPKTEKREEGYEPLPGGPAYMDYRLLCLDAKGQTLYHKDMLRTDWMYNGTFGLLEGELLLRIGDWFLVLEPKTFAVKEKIPVHTSAYIPWKETEMTRDEHQADYQAKLDALLEHCKTCKWLDWSPGPEYLVFVQGKVGKRAAWEPMSYEEEDLVHFKQRFEPLTVTLHAQSSNEDSTRMQITDNHTQVREVEYLSGGTQFSYPNYMSRTVLQYELTKNEQKVRFSTSDRDAHSLRLRFSDNLILSMADESVWVVYEGTLYRILVN